ncbi:MAG: CPBP family intramembrane metalloprotease [Gemmataceae bacterium]|nr:CPBP family intramembrane metalloprotease [Gemmataceae bacterium]
MLSSSPPVEQPSTATLLRGTAVDVAAALVLGAAVWLPLLVALRSWAGSDMRHSLLIIIVGNQVGFVLVGRHRSSPPKQGASRTRNAIGMGLLVAVALILLGVIYDMILRLAFGAGTPTIGPWGAIRSLDRVPAILMLVVGTVAAPAAEEWFFRGVLFRRWADAGQSAAGAVLSALLYAAAALDAWNAPAYLAMGLILTSVYARTGTLLAPWTAHAFVNSAMLALLFSGYE